MKLNIKHQIYTLLLTVLTVSGVAVLSSCEDEPDKYKIASGTPEILYARMPDIASADSLITGAYMGTTVCFVGNNLRSITEMYFNDQKAVLNTSFITDHTLFVTVPGTIPEEVTDMIYLVNSKQDTVRYEFSVLVPAPQVTSMSNEYANEGDIVTIYGDYFLDDESGPLSIMMAGNLPVTEITSITKTAVSFCLPEGSSKGYITVTTIYGTGRSKFQYKDDRNILLDWDTTFANGWRPGVVQGTDPEGISGDYVIFQGSLDGESGASWNEDGFSFNYWAANASSPDLFDAEDWENMTLKFEINVTQPWSACALQMIFTTADQVSLENDNNTFITDESIPRALWRPWEEIGSYTTDGWRTISVPLSEFKYTHIGGTSTGSLRPGHFTGLTFFVYAGGINGTDCSPVICIDNIRVMPAE
ncbi:MAG: glycan-binding surface protein [Bacteroides sp.]|nr:glycan-binding surface protein [Bacteroides sp.]